MLWLFSQTGIDSLAGGSGWVGAGLLGLVLGWLLLKHLPDKDRQLKDLIDGKDKQFRETMEGKDKQLADILTQKWAMLQQMGREYKDSLKEVTAHCETELTRLTGYWQGQMTSMVAAIQDLSEKMDDDLKDRHKG